MKRITLRTIFWFWIPLAFSWLLMTFEGPWIQGVISRQPDPELQLAAFGLVMSLSVTIEAPVIMFLAVGSALARNRQSYGVLWWYTMMINVLVTVVAVLMAFTPLLDWYLGGLLGIPDHIIAAVRPGMVIMILWSAFIGYRRFHQGILINHDRTNTVGTGTIIRVVASAGVAVALGIWSQLPGAVVGAFSLISAVLVEMIYVHIISRPDVAQLRAIKLKPDENPLTYGDALKFHAPLALTSLLTLFVRPVIESGLASTPDAQRALAAFPVIFSILLVMRSGGMAWQEVVIALSKRENATRPLRRFTWLLGTITSTLTLLLALTPAIDVYTGVILGVPSALIDLIAIGTLFGFLVPIFTTLQSYLRALLMLNNTTAPIYQAMFIGFVLTAIVMWGGVALGFAAIPTASVAMSAGTGVELLYLVWAYTRQQNTIALLPSLGNSRAD